MKFNECELIANIDGEDVLKFTSVGNNNNNNIREIAIGNVTITDEFISITVDRVGCKHEIKEYKKGNNIKYNTLIDLCKSNNLIIEENNRLIRVEIKSINYILNNRKGKYRLLIEKIKLNSVDSSVIDFTDGYFYIKNIGVINVYRDYYTFNPDIEYCDLITLKVGVKLDEPFYIRDNKNECIVRLQPYIIE